MASEEHESKEYTETKWIRRFIVLFFLGFFIILAGIIITVAVALLYSESVGSFGGFIFIGPVPIVFGAGPEATWLALFAIILGILSVILLLLLWRRKS